MAGLCRAKLFAAVAHARPLRLGEAAGTGTGPRAPGRGDRHRGVTRGWEKLRMARMARIICGQRGQAPYEPVPCVPLVPDVP